MKIRALLSESDAVLTKIWDKSTNEAWLLKPNDHSHAADIDRQVKRQALIRDALIPHFKKIKGVENIEATPWAKGSQFTFTYKDAKAEVHMLRQFHSRDVMLYVMIRVFKSHFLHSLHDDPSSLKQTSAPTDYGDYISRSAYIKSLAEIPSKVESTYKETKFKVATSNKH
jgi:hypothetical protein